MSPDTPGVAGTGSVDSGRYPGQYDFMFFAAAGCGRLLCQRDKRTRVRITLYWTAGRSG